MSPKDKRWALIVVFALLVIRGTSGTDLMLQVDAGKEECFFEDVEVNKTLYIDYSVVGTNQGELDINFQLSDTQGRPVVTEFRRTESRHEIPVSVPGFYKICFDNTFSHFSFKTIAFAIALENESDAKWNDYDENSFQPEGVYDMQVNDIKSLMERVKVALNKIEIIQNEFRLLELKDRTIAENNFERVNFWSFVYMFLLFFIGTMQVFVVKGLFDEKYTVHRLMKKMKG